MIAQENTSESQCEFRSNRGNADVIFVLRQIQEECRESNRGLHAAFVDFTKAFDTVSSDGLWKILAHLWFSTRIFHHPPLCSKRSVRSDEAQRVTVGQLPHIQRRQAGVRPGDIATRTCSPSSSASGSVRQKRTYQTASTSISEQTEVCSTLGVSSHAQKLLKN